MKETKLILKDHQTKEDQMKKGRIRLISLIGNNQIVVMSLRKLTWAKLNKEEGRVELVVVLFWKLLLREILKDTHKL